MKEVVIKINKVALYVIIGFLAVLIALVVYPQLQKQETPPPSGNSTLVLGDPSIGPENAKVVIIEYSDFQCPACGAGESIVKQILDAYKDKIKLIYKDFPLDFHPYAQRAAEAAQCAFEQNKYWEYHDILFSHQNALDIPNLKSYAKDLGLDTVKFDSCVDSRKYKSDVEKDQSDGISAGVDATPTFFVNGKKIRGVPSLSNFKSVIDSELAK